MSFHNFKSAVCLLAVLSAASACAREVKEPAVAGAFYPGDKEELAATVDRFVAAGRPAETERGRLLALVVPHAGYVFSGGIAGEAYARLKGQDIRTVVLIGPAHRARLQGAAVYTGDAMRTPLGEVRVDRETAASLASDGDGVTAAREPFIQEHSLEVQLPFLQRTLKNFRIVPILVGSPTGESYRFLAQKIADILRRDPKALLVISTDFSHYRDQAATAVLDGKGIDAIVRLSANDLQRLLNGGETELCGAWPALYALAALRQAGATEGVLFRRADSGETGGEKGRVVGYAAIGLYKRPLSAQAKEVLIRLARETVERQVTGSALPEPRTVDPRLLADGAAFVTLKKKDGSLRGCIGNLLPAMPLCRAVIANAVSAAVRDRRFPPVTAGELPGLEVEVTVLSPMEPLADVQSIRIGEHGLYLEAAGRSSVFLPQVPVEQGWDREVYLRELALKAGLPPDGWKSARLSTFTAEIVKEPAPARVAGDGGR